MSLESLRPFVLVTPMAAGSRVVMLTFDSQNKHLRSSSFSVSMFGNSSYFKLYPFLLDLSAFLLGSLTFILPFVISVKLIEGMAGVSTFIKHLLCALDHARYFGCFCFCF